MHTTSSARLVLVCLLAAAGTVVLARLGEARFAARATGQRAAVAQPARPPQALAGTQTSQGDALRDGRGVDPNLAAAVELELLPGVGPRLAQAIVHSREQQGRFSTLRDLRRVRGLGEKTLAKIAPLLLLPDSPRAAPGAPGDAAVHGRAHSEGLEHPAHAQRDVGRVEQLPVALEQQRGAHVQAQGPAARGQVIDTEHQLSADAHGQQRP